MYACIFTFIMRINANYTLNLYGERGESRVSASARFAERLDVYIHRRLSDSPFSLHLSTFFVYRCNGDTKSFFFYCCSLLRRFRLALDHRRVFVLVLNLRLAAQPVAFSQLFLPEFLPLRVRRSTQTLARIAHEHRTRPALAVTTAIHEF